MVFVAVVAGVAMLAGAAVIFSVEHSHSHANIRSFPSALWWAVGTITTVGTNNYPTTATGRIVAATMMIIGVALAGIFTAAIATYFIAGTDSDHKTESHDVNAKAPHVAHELAAMTASMDRLHAELNDVRALLSEREPYHPPSSIVYPTEGETGRRDDVVH